MSDKCKSLDLVHAGLSGSDGINLAICAERIDHLRQMSANARPPGAPPSGGEAVGPPADPARPPD